MVLSKFYHSITVHILNSDVTFPPVSVDATFNEPKKAILLYYPSKSTASFNLFLQDIKKNTITIMCTLYTLIY